MNDTKLTPELEFMLGELMGMALRGRSASLAAAFSLLAEATKVVSVTRIEGVENTPDGEIQWIGPSREFRALMDAVRDEASDMMHAEIPDRAWEARVRKTIPDWAARFFAAIKGSRE